MHSLFEKQNSLNAPIDAFIFDTGSMSFPVKQHWHYFAEFLYVTEGSGQVTCDDRTHIVKEGELIILPPSSVHSITHAGKGLKTFAGIKFDTARFQDTLTYTPSVANILSYARSENMKMHFGRKETESFHCKEIFDACVNEFDEYQYGRDTVLRSYVYRLFFAIVRYWISEGLDINNCPINPSDHYGIENIAEYIDEHLEENIRVTGIAEKCNMSYSGFATKFHDLYGMTCKEYIEKMRIFKAEEYLLFTDNDLAFISEKTGFADTSHFIRIFKKHRGITPKQFRKQNITA
jgi:AraC-like DNA-binding protein